jgi:hypothetical protein
LLKDEEGYVGNKNQIKEKKGAPNLKGKKKMMERSKEEEEGNNVDEKHAQQSWCAI